MVIDKQSSFQPPQAVRSAARRGLELRRRHGRGGLTTRQAGREGIGIGTGVRRASDLAAGRSVSLATIRRMLSFFKQNEANNRPAARESDGGPTAGTIAWLLWGGTPGRRWANRVLLKAATPEHVAEPMAVPPEQAKGFDVEVAKVDDSLGIVFGYAIVCKVDGDDYYDVQGDHIPEDSMLRVTARYMEGARHSLIQHQGEPLGRIVFGYPLTSEIAKALDLRGPKTGFLVGLKPSSPEVLARFRSGELTGFSIGGRRRDEVVIDG